MKPSRLPRTLALAHNQRGMALIFVLIFLVILTMLGTSASLNNSMQERMAGNTRNRDLAFQAAEAALDAAAATMASWRGQAFNGSAGLFTYSASQANDAAYWRDLSHWASYRTPAQSLGNVAQQPRYQVEKMPTVGTTEYYRVTARGVGGDGNAVVVLQAVYSFTPSPSCP